MDNIYSLFIKFFKIIFIINLLIFPSSAISDNFSNVANKLLKVYEYDDKINNYIISIFSFTNSQNKKSSQSKNKITNNNSKIEKHYFKIKSNKKVIYSFGDGKSVEINPSKFDDKIIFNASSNSYFKIEDKSIFYGIKFNF